MDDLTYAQGMALLISFCILVYIAWLALTAGPSRKWIKRMRQIEDGRRRQEAEFIASNCFRDWRKP